ncbi:MAG: hypothetical protein RLZZ135_48 [Cyanobacteriota bacterium]|jgi:hypothetical protein
MQLYQTNSIDRIQTDVRIQPQQGVTILFHLAGGGETCC